MKKNVIMILMMAFISTAIYAEQPKDSESNKQRKCPRRVKVITKTIVPIVFKEFKDIEKKVIPSKEITLFTGISGVVKSIDKAEGDEIKSGDIILTLDTDKYEKELKVQKNKVTLWKKKLTNRRNWKTRSERAEKQAETLIADIQSIVNELEEKIRNSVIVSNDDGVLGKTKVTVGDLLSNNFEIGSILNLDEIKINLLDHSDKIEDLQKVNVYIEELSENFEATAKKNEGGSASLYIANSNKTILKGMTAKFSVLVNKYEDAITLPSNLILKENSIRFAYIVNGKKARKAILDTGHTDKNGIVLIKNGLKINDAVIISELLSTKTGVLSNDVRCINDGKKIKIMALDKNTGKYVKKKYGKASVQTSVPVKIKAPVTDEIQEEDKKDDKDKIEKEIEKGKEEIDKKKEEEKKVLKAQKIAEKEKKKQEKLEKERLSNEKKLTENKERNEKLEKLYKEKILLKTQWTDIKKKLNLVNTEIESLDKKSFFGRLSLGATVSYNKMTLSNFEDIYGRIINPGIDITFDINNKLDIWLSAAYSSKTATADWTTDEFKFSYIPVSLDIRYKFANAEKFSFLGGFGISYYTFEDVNPIETLKDSIVGFNILAGTKYSISKKVSLSMLVKMNFIKKDLEATELSPDNALDLGSIELLFGISFKLGK